MKHILTSLQAGANSGFCLNRPFLRSNTLYTGEYFDFIKYIDIK